MTLGGVGLVPNHDLSYLKLIDLGNAACAKLNTGSVVKCCCKRTLKGMCRPTNGLIPKQTNLL